MLLKCLNAAVDCGALPVPKGGVAADESCPTTAGSSCAVDCLEGHTLIGEAILTCLNNGLWSDTGVKCQGM